MITYSAILLLQQYLNTFLQNKSVLNFLWNNQIHSANEADFLDQYQAPFDPKMPVGFFTNHTVQNVSVDEATTILWHKFTLAVFLKKRRAYTMFEAIETIGLELQSVPRGVLPFVLSDALPSDITNQTFHLSVFKTASMEIRPKDTASSTGDLSVSFALEAVIEVE